jgi:hypothetical protein
MAVPQADRVKENRKLALLIENLEQLHNELYFQALSCESTLF